MRILEFVPSFPFDNSKKNSAKSEIILYSLKFKASKTQKFFLEYILLQLYKVCLTISRFFSAMFLRFILKE